MKCFIIIACLWTITYSQTPAQWWQLSDSSQKAFAAQCYEFGKQYGRGHTLAAIAWMESSLGRTTKHSEKSFGPFGISEQTAKSYLLKNPASRNNQLLRLDADISSWSFGEQACFSIEVLEDNISGLQRLGYSSKLSYFWAYPKYNAGKHWRRFRRRGEVFQQRTKFLVNVVFPPDND